MQSNIQKLALEKGITSPQELSYAAKVTWPTANSVWSGDISKTQMGNGRKIAAALGVRMEDLFVYIDEKTALK